MTDALPSGSADDLDMLPPVGSATPRSSADIERLLVAGDPVILTGAIEHWPILAAAANGPSALGAYLRARARGATVPVMEAPPATGGRFGYAPGLHDFSFTKRYRPLGETLDRIERAADGDGTIAIQMLPLDQQLPDMVRENPMPLVPATASPKLWLGGRVRTQIHNDRDHNLACVIAGRRRFVLFPPDQVGNLYVGPIDNPPPLSLVDPEAPDFSAYPRFRAALDVARVAHLGPGDALLMPKYWWHHVTSLDGYNAMINYWWGDQPAGLGNPYDAFLTALLAFKDLPPAERDYWHAMVDAYVFRADGSRIDHLPPGRQGILGAMTPALRTDLVRRLKAAVLKS